MSKPSDGLEPSTPSLPSSNEAGTPGKPGKPRARKPRKKKETPKTSDLARTRVPALVVPECSLASARVGALFMSDESLRESAAEWAEKPATEQGLPPRVADVAILRHVARVLGLLEPDQALE